MSRSNWRHARYRQQGEELLMTPMIDVVFLLLIFFVCTASFQAIELILPSNLLVSSSSSLEVPLTPPDDLEEIVIEVAPGGDRVAWTVNGQPCTTRGALQELLLAIASIDSSLPAIIDCDDQVALADAIATYDLARSVGLGKVQFAADAP